MTTTTHTSSYLELVVSNNSASMDLVFPFTYGTGTYLAVVQTNSSSAENKNFGSD